MKSDVILIDNLGNGFGDAVKETKKAAEFRGLSHKDALQLQLMAEEMLSMARSVTGEMQASFWLESQEKAFDLHMTTKTVMDQEKRCTYYELPQEVLSDLPNRFIEDPEWDRYEQSILHRLADNVKIDIRGQLVHMTVSKRFAE